jgi:hypothetical protein
MDKFTQAYIPGCKLAVDEAMIGFKGRFFSETVSTWKAN